MDEQRRAVLLLYALADEDRAFDADLFQRWEHPVEVCAGPEAKNLCPLLGGVGRAKFEAVHGIVFKLDLDRPQHRAILRRYRDAGGPDLPTRVACKREQAQRYRAFLADVEIWDHEPTTADLDGFAAEVESVDRFG